MKAPGIDKPQRITMEMPHGVCKLLLDQWLSDNAPIDLRVSRAKSIGMVRVVCDVDIAENPDGLLWVTRAMQSNDQIVTEIKAL